MNILYYIAAFFSGWITVEFIAAMIAMRASMMINIISGFIACVALHYLLNH